MADLGSGVRGSSPRFPTCEINCWVENPIGIGAETQGEKLDLSKSVSCEMKFMKSLRKIEMMKYKSKKKKNIKNI